MISPLPRINPKYAYCPGLNINNASLSLSKTFHFSNNFSTVFSKNNSPWIHKDLSLESGTQMWHMNFTFYWRSKSGADTRRNLWSCQLLAPLRSLGKQISSISLASQQKLQDDRFQTPHCLSEQTLSTHSFLHFLFSTCSCLLTQIATTNNSKKQWELMTSFIPSV